MAVSFSSRHDLTFDTLTRSDLERLRGFAFDVSIARGRTDVRRRVRLIGAGTVLVGFVLALSGTLVHLAWALPLGEVIHRPAVLVGAMGMVVGALTLGISAPAVRLFHGGLFRRYRGQPA